MPYVALALRCLIGVVFLTSSLSKVAGRGRFHAFAESLRTMDLLPGGWVGAAARIIVVAEFATWMLLVVSPAAGFVLAATLLTVFAVGIAHAVRRGVHAPCQCFGGTSVRPLGRPHVLRNVLLAAGAAVGTPAVLLPGELRPAGACVAALAGLCGAGLVVLLDDFLELFAPAVPPVGRGGGRGDRDDRPPREDRAADGSRQTTAQNS
ncbi:putative membrane protein YphA (DoxX/SURF4 family) [Streptomyces umbrinus]|uniref:Membrane protein YphA (DoxX/SURF4 family) n=1 Tax=Streptomyces umbrinus TaxID=67370 RepID=A0ABU0SNW5_9ACTN|nr:MauE/DoxX family redox-associated membrane protein [Streptomyces umbrinus]MDQ1025264.1 putative membrane protein YphA (DoxX/SURF4 family) [Streptomyces umbrinus]